VQDSLVGVSIKRFIKLFLFVVDHTPFLQEKTNTRRSTTKLFLQIFRDFQKYAPFFNVNLVLFHHLLPVQGKIERCVKLEMSSRSTWKPMYFNSNIFLKFSQCELRRHIHIRRAIGCSVYWKIGVHLVQQQ
jgi:hypothetical protein